MELNEVFGIKRRKAEKAAAEQSLKANPPKSKATLEAEWRSMMTELKAMNTANEKLLARTSKMLGDNAEPAREGGGQRTGERTS